MSKSKISPDTLCLILSDKFSINKKKKRLKYFSLRLQNLHNIPIAYGIMMSQ